MQPMFVSVSIYWGSGFVFRKCFFHFSYHEEEEGNQTGFLPNNSGQPRLINYRSHNKSVNFTGLSPKSNLVYFSSWGLFEASELRWLQRFWWLEEQLVIFLKCSKK